MVLKGKLGIYKVERDTDAYVYLQIGEGDMDVGGICTAYNNNPFLPLNLKNKRNIVEIK